MKSIGSLLLGAIIAGVNLLLLTQLVRRAMGGGSRRKLILLVVAKFMIFFGIISLILWKGHVSPLAFLGGFSIPLIGYLCISLRGST